MKKIAFALVVFSFASALGSVFAFAWEDCPPGTYWNGRTCERIEAP